MTTPNDVSREEVAVTVLEGVVAIALMPLLLVSHGWVFWAYWGWFIEPLVGVPLGYWHAAGLSALVSYLRNPTMRRDSEEPFVGVLMRAFGAVAFYLPIIVLVGWIIQGLMP